MSLLKISVGNNSRTRNSSVFLDVFDEYKEQIRSIEGVTHDTFQDKKGTCNNEKISSILDQPIVLGTD